MTQNALNNTASTFTVGTSATTNNISVVRSAEGQWLGMDDQTDEFGIYNSTGTPEGGIAADIGSICTDTTNGVIYVKQTDTANTGWAAIGGTTGILLQSSWSSSSTGSGTAAVIPADNTIPQITEGASGITHAFTATSSTNPIFVESWSYTNNVTATGVGALFKQGTSNAFAATGLDVLSTFTSFYLAAFTTAGSTSSVTYEMRYGTVGAGTVYLNRSAGADNFGATQTLYLRVSELST